MKNFIKSIVCCLLVLIMVSGSGCALFAKKYTVSYTDESGTHKITATAGKEYALEQIPEKIGYEFLGLFDAETAGTQYVSSNGKSLNPFKEKADIILYPQYKAKEYVIIFDYQGAELAGSRSITVTYGTEIANLPENLVFEGKTFTGWYTQADCGGVCVYDNYGAVPLVSILNAQNFDIENQIYLYAGFADKMCSVKFDFGGELYPETMSVPYGTPLSQVAPTVRNNRNLAVLAWSDEESKESVFDGEIVADITLYAVEWAPVLVFDENGGKERRDIVEKAGTNITLPYAEREGYEFMGWKQADGTVVKDVFTMPADTTTLTAVWQAYIIFDENFGTEVQNITQAVGTAIAFPTITREGYFFAGWYTENGEEYTEKAMPGESTYLKAGWYKEKTIKKVALENSEERGYTDIVPILDNAFAVNVSDILGNEDSIKVKGVCYVKMFGGSTGYIDIYSSAIISSEYLLGSYSEGTSSYSYKTCSFEIEGGLTGDTIYVIPYVKYKDKGIYFKDIYLEITYPDMAAGLIL